MKKQKIHRIGNSKEPTISQLTKMVDNLKHKHPGFSSISIYVWGHSETKIEYSVSVDGTESKFDKSWPEALKSYRKLMKG